MPVVEGGTGVQTILTNGVVLGNGVSAISTVAVGTTNTVLLGNTAAPPTFGAVPNAALVNDSITVAAGTGINVSGSPVVLGGTVTISTTGVASSLVITSGPTYVATSTDYYIAVNSSAGAVTVQLPNAPATARTFVIKDQTGSAASHNITVTTVGGTVNLDGATTFVMNTAYQAANFIFDGTAYEVF